MLTIRPARLDDADTIGRLGVQVWQETYPGIVPQRHLDEMNVDIRSQRWRGLLSTQPADHFYGVAFDGSDLIGYAGGGPARDDALKMPAVIYMINILKSGQKRGVGRALMRYAAQSLIERGNTSAGLWVFVENHNARAFYRHLGGIETDIRGSVDFDGDTRTDMAVHWPDIATLAA